MADLGLSTILMGLGTVISAGGTIASGVAQSDAMDYKAEQERMAAQENRAASQRTMQEHQTQLSYQQSKLQAGAAATGAGADDPTVVKLGSDMAGRGEYQSLMDLYTGENRARGMEDQAKGDNMTGDAAMTGSLFGAAGTLASGFGGMKYRMSSMPQGNYG